MRKVVLSLLFCMSLFVIAQTQNKVKNVKVSFKIENVKSESGFWMLAVYNENNEFLSMQPFNAKRQKVGDKKNTIKLNLPEGTYAVALFQDLNNNKNLDRGERGIPTEPYSFSGQSIFPLRGKPTFKQCAIKVSKSSKSFALDLQVQ